MATWNPAWASAISGIESSGRYNLMGPITRSGDRAHGKYQVMGANIGPWTREALGRELSPQEFLNDTDAQEAVFRHQFGKNVDKYGSPQEAASVWFSGRPMAQAGNAKDVLGPCPLTSPSSTEASEPKASTPSALQCPHNSPNREQVQ